MWALHLPLNSIDRKNQPPPFYIFVQDGLILITGTLWTIAYLLYFRQGMKDCSYGMPIIALCANLGWEIIYGIFFPLSVAETLTFVPWIMVDLGIAYTTLKFGSREWIRSPIIATNMGSLLIGGTIVMTLFHWAFIRLCSSVEEAAFWAGFACQACLGCASVFQLMSRDSTRGHSLEIWICRLIGSATAISMFCWRYAYYKSDYPFVGTPLATLLFILAEVADLMYILIVTDLT